MLKTERRKDTKGHQHTAEETQEQMCCDDSGRTAEEHRKESPDGKCCVDE